MVRLIAKPPSVHRWISAGKLVAELVLGNHVEDGAIPLSPRIKLIAGAEWMCGKAI
jgi:hypothetical protein